MKAVHIEFVTNLTTEAFLPTLRRFIAHQGKPKTIYSDNGTNFQGAANELHEIYKMLQSTSLSRWQTYQQQFWQRWSSDYLQTLQQRQCRLRTCPNLQPGDLVLLREDNTTPFQWPTAVITNIHSGKDGIIHLVTLRTPKGVSKRPITKICPLPHANTYIHTYIHTYLYHFVGP